VFGDAWLADWLAATIVAPGLAELTAKAVKPKPLATTAELASATTIRVLMTFIMQSFPALARRMSHRIRYSTCLPSKVV
jgi:hypothetical protein